MHLVSYDGLLLSACSQRYSLAFHLKDIWHDSLFISPLELDDKWALRLGAEV